MERQKQDQLEREAQRQAMEQRLAFMEQRIQEIEAGSRKKSPREKSPREKSPREKPSRSERKRDYGRSKSVVQMRDGDQVSPDFLDEVNRKRKTNSRSNTVADFKFSKNTPSAGLDLASEAPVGKSKSKGRDRERSKTLHHDGDIDLDLGGVTHQKPEIKSARFQSQKSFDASRDKKAKFSRSASHKQVRNRLADDEVDHRKSFKKSKSKKSVGESRDRPDRIDRLLKKKNLDGLKRALESIPVDEIPSRMAAGDIPMSEWAAVAEFATEKSQSLAQLETSNTELLQQLSDLQQQLTTLTLKQASVQEELQIAKKASEIVHIIQPFVAARSKLVKNLQDNLVKLEEVSDLTLALQIYDVGHLLPGLTGAGLSVESILSLNSKTIAVLQLSLPDKLALLYAVSMIQAKSFDPHAHEAKCQVCSNPKPADMLKFYGAASDAIAAIEPILGKLKSRQLIFYSHFLPAELDLVTRQTLSSALDKIRTVHDAAK
jgi:hypothetical protein